MGGCGSCAAARARRAAERLAQGKSTGTWSVTLPNGHRECFDNKLAAEAFNVENGNTGMVRPNCP